MSIARNILILREKNNWNVPELAAKIGASKQQVYAWEAGDYEPGKKFLTKLAEVFKVSVADLYRENAKNLTQVSETLSHADQFVKILQDSLRIKDEYIEILKAEKARLEGELADCRNKKSRAKEG